MAVELEGLEFQIEAKSEEGTKGIDALTASLGKLKQATKGGLGLNSKVKELNKLNEALKGFHTDKLESLGKALGSLNSTGKASISPTIPKRLNEIAQSLHEIGWSDIEKLEDLGKALRELQEVGNVKIPKITVPSSGVAPTMNTPAGTTSADAATSGVEQATSSVQETAQVVQQVTQRTSVLKHILNGIGGVFTKGFSLGTGALHKLGNALTKVKMAGAKARTALGKLKDLLGSALAAKVKQNTSGLGKLFNSMKRIAMYRAIRFALSQLTQAMKDGINNLYQYSNAMGGTFAQNMDRLATSGQYLKNSLGAMAAPIINALAPAIDFVIDKIVTLLNLINMLFARLSGASTFTAAKKNATSYGDSLESAGGSAAKAAKEIRDATTGIDELNIIMQKDNAGSGGGGGSGTDYGSMFEELPIDNSVSEFADKLKQAFDNADWKTLGTLLGEKVNEIVDSINWEGVGHKIGYGLNGAIQTAYWFLKTVDFHNIGQHVAELINGALEEVDTTFIGRTIVRWFTLKFDFILGVLGGLDWGLIARKVSDCIKGAFDEATEWLKGYDWSQMGKDLWNNIKEVVANIDWGGIATSIFTFLGTAIRSAADFLGSFFGSIGADIKAWWDSEIQGQDWKETAGNLLNAIGQGFADIGGWVMDNIVDPFCNALLGEDLWADVKQAGSDMWAGFTKGITDFFNDPGGWIKTNIVDPFVNWIKNLFGIHSPSTVMAEIGGYIIEGLLNGILAPFKNIGKWVKDHIVAPLVEAFEGSPVAEFVVGVKNTAETWWSNVNAWWDRKVGAVQSFTTNVVNNATTWWNNTKTWWSGKVGAVKNFTTSVVNQAADWWSKVNTWWNGKVGAVQSFTTSVVNHASTWWSNVKTWWSGKVGAVQQFTTSVKNDSVTWWNNVKTWWSGKVGAVKEFTTTVTNQASTWWSNVKTWWSGKVGAVQQFTTSVKNESATWWSNVKTWWSGRVGAVQQFTTSVKNEASTWWSNVKTWWSGKVGAVQQFTTSVRNDSSTWWSNVKTWWSGKVGNLSVGVAVLNQASTWWSNVKSWWSQKAGSLTTTLNVKTPHIKINWGTVTAFGKSFDYPKGFSLEWYAKGGILDGAQIFGMLGNSFLGGGEAGREAVLPLESHTEWMDTLADKVRSGLPDENSGGMQYGEFRRALADFYAEYVQGTMSQMASDMNRQANKKEQTTVQVGNRVITDAVKTQQDANGYRFTT